MFEQHFLSPASEADVFGPLQGGERVMWRGRCGVAEYAFDEAASLPRWALPETTDVLVTDRRVIYVYTADSGYQIRSGELRWLWPQHLRVQPGARSTDRGAAATQIQLVCGGTDGTYPALVFAGGELSTVSDADRLANLIRQAIARFRVDNVAKLGLTADQGRMLSRLLIGPEFSNHQGGGGQTVSLLGALLVNREMATPEVAADPPPVLLEAEIVEGSPLDDPVLEVFATGEDTRLISYRPGRAADAARALMAAKAEESAQQSEPATASRAADLAARIARLVSRSAEPAPAPIRQDQDPEPEANVQERQQFHPRLEDRPTDDYRSFGDRLAEMRSVDAGRPEEPGSPGHEAWSRGPWEVQPEQAETRRAVTWHSEPWHSSEPRHSEPWHSEIERLDISHPEELSAEPLAAERAEADRMAAEQGEMPTTNLTQRAESMRRTAARMAANAARGRAGDRRGDRETGITPRGNRNG